MHWGPPAGSPKACVYLMVASSLLLGNICHSSFAYRHCIYDEGLCGVNSCITLHVTWNIDRMAFWMFSCNTNAVSCWLDYWVIARRVVIS